eukprot:TRINITY_DN314_c0_g1_i2.p1 TRINITY_DN314_c0_g1~~TRINITY_DN314_c0_g1_i2.p1  ORF type:complete len:129 (-),score=27.47 TRINITY_DN314_c0_g1_i2:275-661(-)
MEPAPSYDNQALFEELLQLEFEPHLIRRALQLTNDKEKAVELIIQFLEGGAEAKEDHKTYEDYKMVFLVRGDLKMGTGKVAAQVGHAGEFSFFSLEYSSQFLELTRMPSIIQRKMKHFSSGNIKEKLR